MRQVKELGALTYLVKPLDIQQIVPAVEAAFANRPHGSAQGAGAQGAAAPGATQGSAQGGQVPTAAALPAFAEPPYAPPPSAPTSAPSSPAQAAPAQDPLDDTVALAVGIVMHRYSLTRRQALDKLSQQAGQEQRSLSALCERLINAQEVLAGLGSL
ncbi:MAG: ANTAR domain-containing protein [Proteobacteria bacterium]|nr:ANTAR domain-containing protein [Pseudomonadota bacterium]